MSDSRPPRVSRRKVLLGIPAVVVAAKVTLPITEAAAAKPPVFECVADLIKAG